MSIPEQEAQTIKATEAAKPSSLLEPVDETISSLKFQFPHKYTRKRVYLDRLLLSSIKLWVLVGDGGLSLIDQSITVCGWTRTMRDQGGFCFVSLNDGSCINCLQVVVDSSVPGYKDLLKSGNVSVSLQITGKVVKSPAKGQVVEMQAAEIKVLGTTDSAKYPLSKKSHTLEHLRDYAHLRARTNTV